MTVSFQINYIQSYICLYSLHPMDGTEIHNLFNLLLIYNQTLLNTSSTQAGAISIIYTTLYM